MSHVQGHSRLQLFVEVLADKILVRVCMCVCSVYVGERGTLIRFFSQGTTRSDELVPPGLCVPSLIAVCVTYNWVNSGTGPCWRGNKHSLLYRQI